MQYALWEEGWETPDGASLLYKLGHYSRTVDKDGKEAEEYFKRASKIRQKIGQVILEPQVAVEKGKGKNQR